MYVIVLTFLEQIKSLPSTQLHQRGMTVSYILTFSLIPCHAEYFHVLHSQIYQLKTCSIPSQSEPPLPIPWNQTSDVHRGSTLIT